MIGNGGASPFDSGDTPRRAPTDRIASHLHAVCAAETRAVAEGVQSVLEKDGSGGVSHDAAADGDPRARDYSGEIERCLGALGCDAELGSYASWVRLDVNVEEAVSIVIGLHADRSSPTGLTVAAVALGHAASSAACPQCVAPFRPDPDEDIEQVERRLRRWLRSDVFAFLGFDTLECN